MTEKEIDVFVKKLKLAMLESGLNQTKLAKKLGLRSASVSQWVLGKNYPKMSTLEEIAKATNRPINYFFDTSTEITGNQNIVGNNNKTTDLEKEILLIKKELEVQKYQIENLAIQLKNLRLK